MKKTRPTYRALEKRLAAAEPIVEALKRQEVDAVVGDEKIAFLLLRKVEEAWLESNVEFSALFDMNGIGIFQADAPAFHLTRVNEKLCEIMGYSAETLLTKNYIGITHPQDQKRNLRKFAGVIRGTCNTWTLENRCIGKNGRVIPVRVHGLALRNQVGQAIRIMVMVEDISAGQQAAQEQERLQKQIQEQTAEMSQFLQSLHGLIARHKPTNQVLRAIQVYTKRSLGAGSNKSATARSKQTLQKKTEAKRKPKATRRRSSS